jgi:DNA processing protein
MIEREHLLFLSTFMPFGPARINLLLNYFRSAEKVWKAREGELRELGLKSETVSKFISHKRKFDEKKYLFQMRQKSIEFVTFKDKKYPENLRGLDDAPPVLYFRGKMSAMDVNAVAIVGSRKMTSYGRDVSEKLATELAVHGVSIVSGLAFGIDATAHKAALSAGGRCIAVLASGVDVVTPKSNSWLAESIIKEEKGALVSEFPLGTEPQKSFFPHRNRIISGLSKAVIVIEGMQKSGTIHTAHHAAKQGREVFAVPGSITSPMSAAPHYLIKNGAKMITAVEDVLEELDMQLKVDSEAMEKVMPADKSESELMGIIENEALHLDELARISGLKVAAVSAKLTVMELKGLVKNLGGGVYKKM